LIEITATAGWSEFLLAIAGATGALVGLVFVALSINLARIIELPGVTGRAAEAIVLLAGTLTASLVALIPHQSNVHLGVSLLMVAVPTWATSVIIQVRSGIKRAYYRPSLALMRAALHQLATLPGIYAGLALCGLLPGGLGWFAFGAIASMLVAMFSAWVLLVEILR